MEFMEAGVRRGNIAKFMCREKNNKIRSLTSYGTAYDEDDDGGKWRGEIQGTNLCFHPLSHSLLLYPLKLSRIMDHNIIVWPV